jgi:hypothetical protein
MHAARVFSTGIATDRRILLDDLELWHRWLFLAGRHRMTVLATSALVKHGPILEAQCATSDLSIAPGGAKSHLEDTCGGQRESLHDTGFWSILLSPWQRNASTS